MIREISVRLKNKKPCVLKFLKIGCEKAFATNITNYTLEVYRYASLQPLLNIYSPLLSQPVT